MSQFLRRVMSAKNLFALVILYAVLGIFTDMQILMFSTLAQPLNELYNETLFKHFGIVASSTGLSSISSLMTLAMAFGAFTSVLVILPKIDTRGRKFVVVYMRFLCGITVGTLQMIAGIFRIAELYMLAQIILGSTIPIQFMATPLYLTECAPDKHRGVVTTSYNLCALFASLLMYFMSSPSIFGTLQLWPVIPFITILLSLLLFIFTFRLPESPKWLVGQDKKAKAHQAIFFYHGEDVDVEEVMDSCQKESHLTDQQKISPKQIFVDETLWQALKLIIIMQLFTTLNPGVIEGIYVISLHTSMGLTVEQSLSISFLMHLIFAPFRFMGTVIVDKFGRRTVIFLAGILTIVKLLMLSTALFIVYISGPSSVTVWLAIINEALSDLSHATGLASLATLFIAELMPPSARVSSAQINYIVQCVTTLPMIVSYPIVASIFPPGFFLLLLMIHRISTGNKGKVRL